MPVVRELKFLFAQTETRLFPSFSPHGDITLMLGTVSLLLVPFLWLQLLRSPLDLALMLTHVAHGLVGVVLVKPLPVQGWS